MAETHKETPRNRTYSVFGFIWVSKVEGHACRSPPTLFEIYLLSAQLTIFTDPLLVLPLNLAGMVTRRFHHSITGSFRKKSQPFFLIFFFHHVAL